MADQDSEVDWDLRNLLYSLRFNTCAATLIPGSNYREQYVKWIRRSFLIANAWTLSVFEDCGELCSNICPDDIAAFKPDLHEDDSDSAGQEVEEEEEEEEEKEEKEEEEEEEEDEDRRMLGEDSD